MALRRRTKYKLLALACVFAVVFIVFMAASGAKNPDMASSTSCNPVCSFGRWVFSIF